VTTYDGGDRRKYPWVAIVMNTMATDSITTVAT
jgi:hypothetical protein